MSEGRKTSTADAQTWKDHLIGGAIMFGLLALPAIGCAMTIISNNPWWLLLLLPLFAFMEAGLFLGAVALVAVSSIMRW